MELFSIRIQRTFQLVSTILQRIRYKYLKYNILMHCADCVKRDVYHHFYLI